MIALAVARENASPLVRAPRADDGPSVWRLIDSTPSLDRNSLYCNLLQCSHFAQTCAIAELNGEVVGWLSGYVPPGRDDTLFVWQVCVGRKARGQGVAKALIGEVLGRDASRGIRYLECTITEDNAASWALFGSVARAMGAQIQRSELFSRDTHFDGTHDSEMGVTIGPFERGQIAGLKA
ncbi:diaminobutyrate acetyltransferase [Pleomorphomonas sp. JP5]|uniref:diaminobutyrate acetyltransferase n=1 Tax=Pleomorphomonas sp. JP5 TaxID=2942998 RepID=UPI002044C4EE|nr:diaminobutyrate acetyltransferase [Pleomorphomonas sp. JP5]MCM5556926.1 diaminobutyrate acetyltransferase [Pleomorphomonas sp. JP5]